MSPMVCPSCRLPRVPFGVLVGGDGELLDGELELALGVLEAMFGFHVGRRFEVLMAENERTFGGSPVLFGRRHRPTITARGRQIQGSRGPMEPRSEVSRRSRSFRSPPRLQALGAT